MEAINLGIEPRVNEIVLKWQWSLTLQYGFSFDVCQVEKL